MIAPRGLSDLQKKAWGSLMGVAVGDAMGMPSSFLTREQIARDFGAIESFLPAPAGHLQHTGLLAGQVTDDTQQTMCLARTILAAGAVEPHAFGQSLVVWAKEAGVFGAERGIVGPTTRIALKEIDKGGDLREIGKYGKTNGAVMRIAPVGILNACRTNDLTGMMRDVENACMPTHWTNIAISGAGAIASTIASFLNDADMQQATALAREAIRIGARLGNTVSGSSILKRLDLALRIVQEQRGKAELLDDLTDLIGNELPVYETVPFCFAIMHVANGDPMAAIKIAANLGGDADTTASIVGGMCGAHAGIEAFPLHVCETIEEVNHLDLMNVAIGLLQVGERRAESADP